MWARHRPDILWSDIAYALKGFFYGKRKTSLVAKIVEGWFPQQEALICLSVRSGFDLLLQESNFPPGSEIIFSGVNISDMTQIACRLGYCVRSVSVDPDNLQVNPEEVLQKITPHTKAIVFAHLFGSRVSIAPIALLAKQHDLMLIEDCAQAFAGKSFAGSPEADVSLFSFGLIKRSTAGGGAVLRVRDYHLREAMSCKLRSYSVQSHLDYARQFACLATLVLLSQHRIYGWFHSALRIAGDPEKIIARMGSTSRKDKNIVRLRRQPCLPLMRLLCHRLTNFSEQKLLCQTEIAQAIKRTVGGSMLGEACTHHTHWVLPVAIRDPTSAIEELRQNGFDATAHSSLCHISDNHQQAEGNSIPPSNSDHWLDQTLFLPTDPAMPDRERLRMLNLFENLA